MQPFSEEDEDRVVQLLMNDILSTTGVGWETMVREAAANVRYIFNTNIEAAEDDDDPEPEYLPRDYIEKVVEDVQQTMHDLFVDTSWPSCPLHPRHPLWLIDGYWTCETDKVAYARLGQLGQSDAG